MVVSISFIQVNNKNHVILENQVCQSKHTTKEKMSEEIEKLKKPQKKPIRYFGDGNQVKTEDAEHIKIDNEKNPIGFSGEVIQVEEKSKSYAKSKFKNKKPENVRNKFHKQKKGLVQIKVDPYARDRHSRKCFSFST